MTTRELFELASLDVMGLLDDDERLAFEEGFRSAPPHIQAQLRAEQTRFSEIERLLPKAEPAPGLRARVVAVVKEAISAASEPIATIGPAGRMRVGSAPLWRAACIGFATAALVLGGFSWKVTQDNRLIADMAISNRLSGELANRAGPGFSEMVTRPSVKHVAFSPAAADYTGKAAAALIIDTETKTAYLVCNGLPVPGGEYQLVIGDDQGNASAITSFHANSGVFYVPIKDVDLASLGRLQIHAPSKEGSRPAPLLVSRGA
jgi:hypothetical protein